MDAASTYKENGKEASGSFQAEKPPQPGVQAGPQRKVGTAAWRLLESLLSSIAELQNKPKPVVSAPHFICMHVSHVLLAYNTVPLIFFIFIAGHSLVSAI